MEDFQVTTVDLTLFIGYVLGTRILFGWYFASKTKGKGAESYFLSGRKLRWPIIGLSFYVANMSGSSFVALPASGYNDGIAAFNYEWIACVLLVFFITFILPLYLRGKIYTSPEYLELRYGRSVRLMFSGFQLFTNVVVDAAAALYAGAMIVEALYPEIPLWITIAAIAAIAGVYITAGGLGAVVINDALQAAMILLGGSTIAILAFRAVPSWDAVRQSAPEDGLSLIQPIGDPILPWPGLLTGVLIIGIYFWCSNQFVIQRALGAKSLDHGRWGSLLAGLLKLPNLFILIMPGVMATQLYPELKNPDTVFATMTFDLLPVGLRGLMLAAVAAAIFSSLEAIFNSASTLFTMDFVRTWRPQMSDRALANTGRAATLGTMLLSAAWAPQIAQFPTLWQYLQSILAYITPPVVAVLLGGVFSKRVNSFGAVAVMVVGIPLGVAAWAWIEVFDGAEFPYLYSCGISFVASGLLLLAVSWMTAAPPSDRVDKHVWRWSIWSEESQALARTAWYKNYRILSGGLLLLTAAIVSWWW